ncbi:MAG: kinase/pyrophosphorylase [Alphaproteobacteria bacterium]|nr:kinase/pyrophosphorylase [Alphaproteobacteria bacterium]
MSEYHIHLVSDATGETIHSITRACIAQFENFIPLEHHWPLIRTPSQIDKILDSVKEKPGLVVFTMVNDNLREQLQKGCKKLKVPFVSVLDPLMLALSNIVGHQAKGQPGRQHEMDDQYFQKIDALTYAMVHDDGLGSEGYDQADVILIGVSRTSKTPTCIYLAHRGIKAANIPIVPGFIMPDNLRHNKRSLIIGLTKEPDRLIEIRQNRLRFLMQNNTSYVDFNAVSEELSLVKKLCAEHHWPIIDITRRSVEETAATIMQMLHERDEQQNL